MRTIPVDLLEHKQQITTSTCFLMKIGPLPFTGEYIAVTNLDKDFQYDDGVVDLLYRASTGMEMSNLSSQNDLTVDNGEAQSLMRTYPFQGITQEMIDSGELDGVEFTIYQVNFRDATMGHVMEANGPIGEVRVRRGGLVTVELRSWSQLLQQNSVVELDSLTCRVKHFGSQPGDEMFPCMYNVAGEWVNDVHVTAVGAETVREFTAEALAQAQDYFAPGLWEWTVGANAGTAQEIEGFDLGGAVTLRFTTPYPIEVGDRGNLRRDCTRRWSGANSCETYVNRAWFRGEPFIPVSDTIALTVPLAGE